MTWMMRKILESNSLNWAKAKDNITSAKIAYQKIKEGVSKNNNKYPF